MGSSGSLTSAEEEVLAAVRSLRNERQGSIRTKWVREETGKDASTTSDMLSSLVDKDAVVRIERGWYDLPEYTGGGSQEDLPSPIVSIPLLSIQHAPESGALVLREEISNYVSYDREKIHRETGVDPARLAMLLISGNSMEPTLRPGDRALMAYRDQDKSGSDRGREARDEGTSADEDSPTAIRRGDMSLQDGSIYLFQNVRRGAIMKRLWWEDAGTVRLESDNSKGSTIHVDITGKEKWAVLGRIVRVEKSL
jgi:phage repressor protein C with HTH and peptisase S24 domain